ncbi:MAG: hypothetical protein JNL85_18930 [Rubrivivax sp.]|nr:hypothetical protein [Rubrivivax sp.]
MNAALGWGLAALAVAAGFIGWGWPGVALALTVIVFWLLLQFSRSLRVLREASGRPVGSVDNAVMLHAKLHRGLRLPQILRLTRSLGRKEPVPQAGATGAAPGGPGASVEERFSWADAGGDSVLAVLRDGRLAEWTLTRRAAGPGAPAPPPQPQAATSGSGDAPGT